MKKIFFLVMVLCMLASPLYASIYTINDDYIGWDDSRDLIGSSLYQIYGMDVSFSAGYMDVKVYTNFKEPDNTFKVLYGDLFISTDGWNPYGAAPYYDDKASNGEDWEFVFDTSEGVLYGGDFTILYSDDYFGSTNYTFRNGQEVTRGAGGTPYAGSSVDLSNVGTYLEYSILLSSLGNPTDIGLKWSETCANDSIEGAAVVPEPSTFFLLGGGLAGLAFVVRRKKKS